MKYEKLEDRSFLLCIGSMLAVVFTLTTILLIIVLIMLGQEPALQVHSAYAGNITQKHIDEHENASEFRPTMPPSIHRGSVEVGGSIDVSLSGTMRTTSGGGDVTEESVSSDPVSTTDATDIKIPFPEPELFIPPHQTNDSTSWFQNKTCVTPECLKELARYLAHRNESVNPCDHFYDHSCQGLPISHLRPVQLKNEYLLRLPNLNEVAQNKWAKFARSCKKFYNLRRSEQIQALSEITNSTENISELLATLVLLDISPYFDVELAKDDNDLKLLLHHPFYKVRPRLYRIVNQNSGHLKEFLNAWPGLDQVDIKNTFTGNHDAGSSAKVTVDLRIESQQDHPDAFSWRLFVKNLSPVNEIHSIQYINTPYFQELFKNMSGRQSIRAHHSKMLKTLATHLYSVFIAESDMDDSGVSHCVRLADLVMKEETNRMYNIQIEKQLRDDATQKMKVMFEKIKVKILEGIQGIADLDRSQAQEILRNVRLALVFEEPPDSNNNILLEMGNESSFVKLAWTSWREESKALFSNLKISELAARLRATSITYLPLQNAVFVPAEYLELIKENVPDYLMAAKVGFELSRALVMSLNLNKFSFNPHQYPIDRIPEPHHPIYGKFDQVAKNRLLAADFFGLSAAYSVAFSETEGSAERLWPLTSPRQQFFATLMQRYCFAAGNITQLFDLFENRFAPPDALRVSYVIPTFPNFWSDHGSDRCLL